jgi:hypothetical protein
MTFTVRVHAVHRRQHYHLFRLFSTLVLSSVSVYFVHYLMLTSSLNLRFLPNSMQKTPAYIITVSGFDERVSTVVALFQKYANLDLRLHYGIHGNRKYAVDNTSKSKLTPGERGLRQTMKGFFTMALRRQYSEVFVFEDDALPHFNFTQLFSQLPDRCRQADVLLLGATMWHATRTAWPSGVCFDADQQTYGAFAMLVKQSAYLPILTWLYQGPLVPFDHMYRYLQTQGVTIRVAHPPFLVIPDVSHPSLINNNRSLIQFNISIRAARHGWHLEQYPLFDQDASR